MDKEAFLLAEIAARGHRARLKYFSEDEYVEWNGSMWIFFTNGIKTIYSPSPLELICPIWLIAD